MWGALVSGAAKYSPSLAKIGLGLYSGSQGSRAVGAATNIQAGQAGENAQLARDLPYRLNPYRQQSAEQWGQHVADVSGQAADVVTQTSAEAAAGARGAAQRGIGYLDPYMSAGGESTQTLLEMARKGLTEPQEKFAFSEDDPSYQWRLEQGQKALERSAAGRGGLQSGATLKSLTNYAQGAASQEYQAAFQRFMDQQKHGLDRTRLGYETLGGLANRGLQASGKAGEFGLEGERLAGDWTTRGAEAAGRFRIPGAQYQSNMMYGANESNLKDIYTGEYAGMDYMSDRAKALAYGQIGQEAQQQQGLQQAFGGVNDLANTYQGNGQTGGGVGGYDMGTGGISPADIYYGQYPQGGGGGQPGPAPPVGRSSVSFDPFWEDWWNRPRR